MKRPYIMKSILRMKIMFLAALIGLFVSCKKNDGYSDEIETSTIPVDTTSSADSTRITTDTVATEAAPQTHGAGNQERADDQSENTTGTGTGPSASSQDGATYTPSSGVQKDSVRPKSDTQKNKKK